MRLICSWAPLAISVSEFLYLVKCSLIVVFPPMSCLGQAESRSMSRIAEAPACHAGKREPRTQVSCNHTCSVSYPEGLMHAGIHFFKRSKQQ